MKKLLILLTITTLFLSGCSNVKKDTQANVTQASTSETTDESSFRGELGLYIPLNEDGVTIEAAAVEDGNAHYFNTTLPSGDPVYFFVVKSPDGKLRAAANGCQVCGGALQGFRQEGDFMVCNTCGNKYPLNNIATEKGGCNPAPISPDLKVTDGMINISTSELKDIQQFFL